MGQLTSFPLLCLINYITFKYCVRRDVPVRINGDDIVFRGTPDEISAWEEGVAKGGLTLSKGKTLKHRRFFTLNSTPFWSCPSGPIGVGFVRAPAVWSNQSMPKLIRSLNSRFYSSSLFYGGERRRISREWFLEENKKSILASRRSLTRGLGLAVDQGMLRNTELWYRELFYLEQWQECDMPYEIGKCPEGWVAEPKWKFLPGEVDAWTRLFQCAVLDQRWFSRLPPPTTEEELESVQRGCFPYGLPFGHKYRRMMRMSRSQAYRWACKRRNSSVFGRQKFLRKADTVMVLKDRSYSGLSVRCPRFVSSSGIPWAGASEYLPSQYRENAGDSTVTWWVGQGRPSMFSTETLSWVGLGPHRAMACLANAVSAIRSYIVRV